MSIPYQSHADFEKMLEGEQLISGCFALNYDSQAWYSISIEEKHFKNLFIKGGDLVSAIFKKCTFEHVYFLESCFETAFSECCMIDCTFVNVHSGYTFQDCTMENFSVFFETPLNEHYYYKKMLTS